MYGCLGFISLNTRKNIQQRLTECTNHIGRAVLLKYNLYNSKTEFKCQLCTTL